MHPKAKKIVEQHSHVHAVEIYCCCMNSHKTCWVCYLVLKLVAYLIDHVMYHCYNSPGL